MAFKPLSQIIEVAEPNIYYVAVTGHRPDKLGGYEFHTPVRDSLRTQLRRVLIELRAECAAMDGKPDLWLITGCALGFDQDAAGVAYRFGIPYLAAVPFEGQAKIWPDKSREVYASVLKHAGAIHIVSVVPPSNKQEAAEMLKERNHWMVDKAKRVICAWDGSRGGTSHCVYYAIRQGKQVIELEVRG